MNVGNLTNILYQRSRTAERKLISTTVALNNLSSQIEAINQTSNNLEDKYNEMSNDIKYIINNFFKNKLINDKYKNNCRHADEINPLLKIIKGKTENIRAPNRDILSSKKF